jgi:hypothetical protein
MVVERKDRDLALAGFFLLLLGREDTFKGMELDFADQTWTPSV